jgi:hypothetical protein
MDFFKIGSHKLFPRAGFEPWSFWSLPPEQLGLQAWTTGTSSFPASLTMHRLFFPHLEKLSRPLKLCYFSPSSTKVFNWGRQWRFRVYSVCAIWVPGSVYLQVSLLCPQDWPHMHPICETAPYGHQWASRTIQPFPQPLFHGWLPCFLWASHLSSRLLTSWAVLLKVVMMGLAWNYVSVLDDILTEIESRYLETFKCNWTE